MASQTFDMGNYIDLGEFNRFGWRISPRPLIDTDLVENGAEAYLHGIELNRGTGRVRLFTAPTATDEQGFAGPDLTTEIEDNGILTIEAGSQTLVLDGLGDTTEPYFWIPSNSAEVIAFANAVSVGTTGTLTIDDGSNQPPTVTIDTAPTTVDAGATLSLNATVSDPGDTYDLLWTGSGTFTPATAEDPSWVAPSPTSQTTYTLTLTATDSGGLEGTDTVDITVRAVDTTPVLPAVADQSGFVGIAYSFTFPTATSGEGPLSYSITGNLPSGLSFNTNNRVLSGTPTTVQTRSLTYRVEDADGDTDSDAFTFTVANPLLLSDSDDTGLEVDAKALLVAGQAGTVSTGFFYRDADRGGTDEPLDGELGLGADESLISGFRRRATNVLQLNDNDNPVTFDISAYFDTGGAGNDLTIYLQTLDGGEVSFLVAGNVDTRNAGQVRFDLPADAQTLLDNLASGDRWIFKAARPAAVAVDYTVNAGDLTFAFSIPLPTVTHTARIPDDHTVNAGDAAFAFALPQPTVTYTPRVPDAHAVNAGDAEWLFALPQPTVTHTLRIPDDYAVDAGDVDWAVETPQPTVTYTPDVTVPDDVVVDIGNAVSTANLIVWSDDVDLGSNFDRDGMGQTLTQTIMYFSGAQAGTVNVSIIGTNDRFTAAFEATGRFIFEASDGEMLEIQIADADMSEPYTWIPANSQQVIDFANHVRGLTDRSATLTLSLRVGGVNAGDVTFAFVLPQPTVTHTARVPDSHTVNAGDAVPGRSRCRNPE